MRFAEMLTRALPPKYLVLEWGSGVCILISVLRSLVGWFEKNPD